MYGLGIFATAIFTLLTPLFVKIGGISFLIATRVIQGLLSGLAVAAINDVYSKWSPPLERSRAISYGTSG